MRHVILLDEKISDKEYKKWEQEDRAFFKKNLGVDAKYWVIRKDFSDYPTTPDSDGDERPTQSYMKGLCQEINKSYGDYGTDFVLMAIHEDNWKSDPAGPRNGIWGVNFSNIYKGYHLQYCRWDRDNSANTFGTLYHERAHAFDALVRTETGKNINTLAGTIQWDRDCVHGKSDKYSYIRHKENTDALKAIAPMMQEAFIHRIKLHIRDIQGRITIWQQLMRRVKEFLNRKNGTPRGT